MESRPGMRVEWRLGRDGGVRMSKWTLKWIFYPMKNAGTSAVKPHSAKGTSSLRGSIVMLAIKVTCQRGTSIDPNRNQLINQSTLIYVVLKYFAPLQKKKTNTNRTEMQ